MVIRGVPREMLRLVATSGGFFISEKRGFDIGDSDRCPMGLFDFARGLTFGREG